MIFRGYRAIQCFKPAYRICRDSTLCCPAIRRIANYDGPADHPDRTLSCPYKPGPDLIRHPEFFFLAIYLPCGRIWIDISIVCFASKMGLGFLGIWRNPCEECCGLWRWRSQLSQLHQHLRRMSTMSVQRSGPK